MSLRDLAVVVPIGPGERAWRGLVPQLAVLPATARIVLVATRAADLPGPGDPATVGVQAELLTMTAPRGRAEQQNAGARAAERPWLWFLHADSRLDGATLPALAASMARTPDGLGYFDLRFTGDGPIAVHLNAIGAFVRSHWLGLPFGDQGFFMAGTTFVRLGGFEPTLSYGEDHALVWAAHRAGVAVVAAGAPLFTSARKYAEGGWLRTTVHHLWLTATQVLHESRRARGTS